MRSYGPQAQTPRRKNCYYNGYLGGCRFHPNAAPVLYCTVCRVTTCQECKNSQHRGHHVVPKGQAWRKYAPDRAWQSVLSAVSRVPPRAEEEPRTHREEWLAEQLRATESERYISL